MLYGPRFVLRFARGRGHANHIRNRVDPRHGRQVALRVVPGDGLVSTTSRCGGAAATTRTYDDQRKDLEMPAARGLLHGCHGRPPGHRVYVPEVTTTPRSFASTRTWRIGMLFSIADQWRRRVDYRTADGLVVATRRP